MAHRLHLTCVFQFAFIVSWDIHGDDILSWIWEIACLVQRTTLCGNDCSQRTEPILTAPPALAYMPSYATVPSSKLCPAWSEFIVEGVG